MTIEQDIEIESALIFLGFEVNPDECDICEDGSVYYGLTQVLPPGSIYDDCVDYPEDGDYSLFGE